MKNIIATILIIFTCVCSSNHANAKCNRKPDPGEEEHMKALMLRGQGNHAEALQWEMKAYEKGLKRAAYELALTYYGGRGTPKNYSAAIHYFSKYPDQSNSAYMIGIIFREGGNGIQKSIKDAVKWFTYYIEIEENPPYYAPLALAEIYENGELTGTSDMETATKWYKKAKKAACSSEGLKFGRSDCNRISAKVKKLDKKKPFLDRLLSIFSLD